MLGQVQIAPRFCVGRAHSADRRRGTQREGGREGEGRRLVSVLLILLDGRQAGAPWEPLWGDWCEGEQRRAVGRRRGPASVLVHRVLELKYISGGATLDLCPHVG